MTSMRLAWLSLLSSIVALSSQGCTHSIRRAALVPHQQPIAHSGAAIESTEVTLGSSTLLRSRQPRLASGENAGIAIPRWQGQGGVRIPWRRNLDLGFQLDYGLDQSSTALSDDQPDPEGDTVGGAVSMHYSAELSSVFRLGLAAELWMYSIPYVEYDTCVDCLGGPYTDIEHDRDLIPVLSLGILPSFRATPDITIFGGFNMRNHPTIRRSDITIGPDADYDEEVEGGPSNFVGSLGAELSLGERFKVSGFVHRALSARPVSYGTAAGLMFTFVTAAAQPAPAPARAW